MGKQKKKLIKSVIIVFIIILTIVGIRMYINYKFRERCSGIEMGDFAVFEDSVKYEYKIPTQYTKAFIDTLSDDMLSDMKTLDEIFKITDYEDRDVIYTYICDLADKKEQNGRLYTSYAMRKILNDPFIVFKDDDVYNLGLQAVQFEDYLYAYKLFRSLDNPEKVRDILCQIWPLVAKEDENICDLRSPYGSFMVKTDGSYFEFLSVDETKNWYDTKEYVKQIPTYNNGDWRMASSYDFQDIITYKQLYRIAPGFTWLSDEVKSDTAMYYLNGEFVSGFFDDVKSAFGHGLYVREID